MLHHPSILLIDDSPGECELLRLALAQTGFDAALSTEHDGETAFHFLHNRFHNLGEGLDRSQRAQVERGPSAGTRSASTADRPGRATSLPSLILLDWRLRNQHGDVFLKRLRADPRFAAIPVVAFTTSDDASDLTTAYANGANGYVVKPGTFDELVRCLGDICRYWLARNRTAHLIETPC